MKILIDLIYLLTAAAISPMVIYRMLRQNRYRSGWQNRFGKIARRHADKKCIWIHAVSVGEVNAATTLIAELQRRFADYEIVISTTTDTGFERASKLFGDRRAVFYFPLDFSMTMRRAFRNIRPNLCLLMELEVWPNLAAIAKAAGVPVVVVNGRISDRSLGRYKLIRPFMKKVLSDVTLILAQTEEYAERFRAIGAPAERVIVSGSLKYDTAQIADKVEGADTLAEQLFGKIENQKSKIKNLLWVTGATGNDEERIILDVYKRLKENFSDLRLAIVPRKPERFDEVAQLIIEKGFGLVRYSEIRNGGKKSQIANRKSQIDVVLGDTMGDLRKFYSLATVIFVGRSLVPMGGSDMMEAAALGKCTIFGPHAFNFKQTVEDLLGGNGAILVKDKEELFKVMEKCLSDSDYARRIAENGREIIRRNQGATQKTIQQLSGLLSNA